VTPRERPACASVRGSEKLGDMQVTKCNGSNDEDQASMAGTLPLPAPRSNQTHD
jgi:hypothetical protein